MRLPVVFMLIFLLSISLGYGAQLDCDTGNFTATLQAINSTNNTLLINSSGTYTLDTSKYTLNTSESAILINSSDTVLDCNNSIFSGESAGKAIESRGNNVTIKNCRLTNFNTGISLSESTNSKLIQNTINSSNFGITFTKTNYSEIRYNHLYSMSSTSIIFNSAFNNTLVDSEISDSTVDIESSSIGKNTILNTTFEKAKLNALDDSELKIKWYFRVHLNDSLGNNINASGVEIRNKDSQLQYALTTDVNGYTPWKNITDYIKNKTTTRTYNNHSIYVSNQTVYANITYNISSTGEIPITLDATPPSIISLNNITTNTTCNISFNTGDASTGNLSYGTDKALSNTHDISTSSNNHKVALTGLNPNTLHYYNITLCNKNGFCTEYGYMNFTTNKTIDYTPPVVSGLTTSADNQSANITFSTDDLASFVLDYGLTQSMNQALTNSSFSASRLINLQDLMSNSLYYYQLEVCNNDSYCTQTSINNFSTEETPDEAAPIISFSKPKASNTTVYNEWKNQKISVSTNEQSTCSIISKSSSIYLASSLMQSSDGLSHSVDFNATSDSTGFNFYITVSCTDNFANSGSKRVYFKMEDTNPPSLSFTSATIDDEEKTNEKKVNIYVSVGEPPSQNPKISINGGANSTMTEEPSGYRYNYTTGTLSEGEYNITVYAKDASSNTASRQRTFYTDYTEPDLDIESPDDDTTLNDCNILEFNLTLDELGTCEYDLFYIDEDDLQDCKDECDDDYDDCMDDAEETSEENDCQDDRDSCKDTCEDEKYQEEQENEEIEILEEVDDCKDNCEEDYDECEETCEDELDNCESQYDSDNECGEDYDDCKEDCEDDEQSCREDCDDMDFTFFKDVEDHLEDYEYLAKFYCKDEAGNEAIENVSFTVDDTTAPEIQYTKPNSTIFEEETHLRLRTSEKSKCRYSTKDADFSDMQNEFGPYSTVHNDKIDDLTPGQYTYYVLCNDTRGNLMSSSEEITFNVNISKDTNDNSDSTGSSQSSSPGSTDLAVKKSFPELKASTPNTFTIEDNNIIVREIAIKSTEDSQDVEVQVEQFNQQDLVESPVGNVYRYFTISKTGISNSQIDSVTVKFRVNKAWLESNDIKPENLKVNQYTDKWNEIQPLKSSEDEQYHYYQADASGFSMFAVTGESTEKKDTTKTPKKKDDSSKDKKPDTDKPDEVDGDGNLYFWIILLCVVVGGGSAAFFYFRSQTKHPQQDLGTAEPKQQTQTNAAADNSAAATSSNQSGYANDTSSNQSGPAPRDELGKYIFDARKAGETVEEITNNLTQAGHNPLDVHERLIQLNVVKDEVKEFIKGSMNAGLSLQEIRTQLVQNGYDESYVDKKLRPFLKSAEEQNYTAGLKDYIKKSIATGLDMQSIKQSLINAGHDPETVEGLTGEFKDDNEELKAYIKKCFDSKLSKYHIKKILKDAGYTKDEVKKAFKELGK